MHPYIAFLETEMEDSKSLLFLRLISIKVIYTAGLSAWKVWGQKQPSHW